MVALFSVVAMVLPLCALVVEYVADAGLSERHHRHHDTFAISSVLTRALVVGMIVMGVLGGVLGGLCFMGVFPAKPEVVLGFFEAAVLVLFLSWALIQRHKVACYDDRMIVTPYVGRSHTIFYAEIERMDWSGFRRASGYRNLDIYVDGGRAAHIDGSIDLEQVLMHIDRFDVLGHSSEA